MWHAGDRRHIQSRPKRDGQHACWLLEDALPSGYRRGTAYVSGETEPTVNKREEMRRKTRALIVDAAVELLIEQGYAATNGLKVQQRLGISRGALLHHFPT